MDKPALSGMRRLFWDIEVSHNVVLAFRAGYDQHIRPESIIMERKIICIAYKWQGSKKVNVLTWDKNQDDRSMLIRFLDVANSADEMVAHHGDRYDTLFFRTRCLINKLSPMPKWKTVDTCSWAKRHFLFNSNALDYISKILGHGGKDRMELDDWKDILIKNSRTKLAKMASYCKTDVEKLELAYLDLHAFVAPKTHVGVLSGKDKWSCAHCGSEDVAISKRRVTAGGAEQFQFKCNSCGGYYSVAAKSKEDYQNAQKSHTNSSRKAAACQAGCNGRCGTKKVQASRGLSRKN